jgi:hypothetical protein
MAKSIGTGSKQYVCPYCGEKWTGTTNRVAKRELNQKAIAFANTEVDKSCPHAKDPQTGHSRPLTMSQDDYLCRRRWMDAYLSYTEEPIVQEKTETKCGDPLQPCPPPGKVAPTVKCAILDIVASCEHHEEGARVARQGETLEVVPGSTYGVDKIELEASVQKACGEHPVWTIGDETKKGVKQTFDAQPPVTSKIWLPSTSPRKYSIECNCCNGPSGKLEVSAYPANQFGVNLDLKKSLEKLRKVLKLAEEALEVVAERFEWKFLEGKIAAEAKWKEHTDRRAFYNYKIAIKFAPLFGLEFKFTVTPLKIVRLVRKIPRIGKYVEKVVNWLVKVGVYLKASAGVECDLKWERDSPDVPKFSANLGAGLTGKLELALGAEAKVLNGELTKVELEAPGAIAASGEPYINDEGFGLEKFKVEFEGIKGTAKLYFLWGIVDINETVTFLDPRSLYGPKRLSIYPPEVDDK